MAIIEASTDAANRPMVKAKKGRPPAIGRPSKARIPAGDRRREIIIAARKVMLTRGYAEASISEIAREASVRDGTLYIHFANKRAILLRVIEEMYESLLGDIREDYKAIQSARERVRYIVRKDLHVYIRDPMFCRLLEEEVRTKPEYIGSNIQLMYCEFQRILQEIILFGIERRELKSDINPVAVVSLILGAIKTLAFEILYLGREIEIDRECDTIISIIFDGIGAPPRIDDVAPSINALLDRIEAISAQLDHRAAQFDHRAGEPGLPQS